MVPVVVADGTLDGRHLRRVANRAAVLDAMIDLWRDGHYEATAAEIAERAGLSPRSLFRYFDDVDDLVRAAIDHVLALASGVGVIRVDPAEDTAVKIGALLASRDELYRTVGVAAHAARVAQHRSSLVAERIAETRRTMRDQLSRLFARELATAAAGVLELVDLMTSFEAWELRQGWDPVARPPAETLLAATLTTLLSEESR